jgi:hypothetical protein
MLRNLQQLKEYEHTLDKSIEKNDIFAKTKIIYKDLKAVAEKLHALKKLKGEE